MTDTIKRQCIDELVTRLAAYTWPALGDGRGAQQTKTCVENPRNHELKVFPAVLVAWNHRDATKTYENVAQWHEVQPMQVTVCYPRFDGSEDVAELLEQYLTMAVVKNTSGTVDVDLGGLGYIEIRSTRTRYGDAKEPLVYAELLLDLETLSAIGDPTSIT